MKNERRMWEWSKMGRRSFFPETKNSENVVKMFSKIESFDTMKVER